MKWVNIFIRRIADVDQNLQFSKSFFDDDEILYIACMDDIDCCSPMNRHAISSDANYDDHSEISYGIHTLMDHHTISLDANCGNCCGILHGFHAYGCFLYLDYFLYAALRFLAHILLLVPPVIALTGMSYRQNSTRPSGFLSGESPEILSGVIYTRPVLEEFPRAADYPDAKSM